MSSVSVMNSDVNRVIDYWFRDEEPVKKWFGGAPEVDAEIKDQFGDLVEKARDSQLNSWTEKPQSTLALVILLDQFTRNIFRGMPASFSSDSIARNITVTAIAKGFDRELPPLQQYFFYMPLSHDESLISQIAAIALFEALHKRCGGGPEEGIVKGGLHFCELHRDVILKFGRFPSRNEILGREPTPEELAFLKEHPRGLDLTGMQSEN